MEVATEGQAMWKGLGYRPVLDGRAADGFGVAAARGERELQFASDGGPGNRLGPLEQQVYRVVLQYREFARQRLAAQRDFPCGGIAFKQVKVFPDDGYVVSEDEPPQGYWNGSDLQTAYLRSGTLNSVTFENRKLGTLIIRKFIEGTNNHPLKGVAFRVTSSDGTDLGPDGGVYYTNAAGEIVLNDLQPDITVKVREIKTVDGYILDGTPQDIRIIGGQACRHCSVA